MPDLLQLGGDAFYRQLFEHAGVPLIATDRDLMIRLWNPATARMFGAGADQMIGTSLVSVIPQKQRDEAERSLRRVIENGQIEELGFQYRDVHGEHCDAKPCHQQHLGQRSRAARTQRADNRHIR